ncbi:uncharacterized protein LOC135822345 [Sycon ciliatum]|uniref:uncharacterized protein LOC135822345 n=1 Tax=Sycon ciliatum TaxID=27933 RepID=UPI0031F6DD1C
MASTTPQDWHADSSRASSRDRSRRTDNEVYFYKVVDGYLPGLSKAMDFDLLNRLAREDSTIAPDEWWHLKEFREESVPAKNLKLLSALAQHGKHGVAKLVALLEYQGTEQCLHLAQQLLKKSGLAHRTLIPLSWIASSRSRQATTLPQSRLADDNIRVHSNPAAWSFLIATLRCDQPTTGKSHAHPKGSPSEHATDGVEVEELDVFDEDAVGTEEPSYPSGTSSRRSYPAHSNPTQGISGHSQPRDKIGDRSTAAAAAAATAAAAAALTSAVASTSSALIQSQRGAPTVHSTADLQKATAENQPSSTTSKASTSKPKQHVTGPSSQAHAMANSVSNKHAVAAAEHRELLHTSLAGLNDSVRTFTGALTDNSTDEQTSDTEASAKKVVKESVQKADFLTILDTLFPDRHTSAATDIPTGDSFGTDHNDGPNKPLSDLSVRHDGTWKTRIKSFAVLGSEHLMETFLAHHQLLDELSLRRLMQPSCSTLYALLDWQDKSVIYLVHLNRLDNALLQLHLVYQAYQATHTMLVLLERADFPTYWLPSHLAQAPVKLTKSSLIMTRASGRRPADQQDVPLPSWASWAFGVLQMTFREFFCSFKLNNTMIPPTLNLHVAVNDPDDDFCRKTKCALGTKKSITLENCLNSFFTPEPNPDKRDSTAVLHNQNPYQEYPQPPQKLGWKRKSTGRGGAARCPVVEDQRITTSSIFTLDPIDAFLGEQDGQDVFLNEYATNLIGVTCITMMESSHTKKQRGYGHRREQRTRRKHLQTGDITMKMEFPVEPDPATRKASASATPGSMQHSLPEASSTAPRLHRSSSVTGTDQVADLPKTPVTPTGSKEGTGLASSASGKGATPTRSQSITERTGATGTKRPKKLLPGPALNTCLEQGIIEKPEDEEAEGSEQMPMLSIYSSDPIQQGEYLKTWQTGSQPTLFEQYRRIDQANPLSHVLLSWKKPVRVICCMADDETESYRILNRTFGTAISPSMLYRSTDDGASRLVVCVKTLPNCLYVILCFHGVNLKEAYTEWKPAYEPLLLAAVGLSNLFVLVSAEMDQMLCAFTSVLHAAMQGLRGDAAGADGDGDGQHHCPNLKQLDEPLFSGKLLLINASSGEADATPARGVSETSGLRQSDTVTVEGVVRASFSQLAYLLPETKAGGAQVFQRLNLIAEEIACNLRTGQVGFYSTGCCFLELQQLFLSAIAAGQYDDVHVHTMIGHQTAALCEQIKTVLSDHSSSTGTPAVQPLYININKQRTMLTCPEESSLLSQYPNIPLAPVQDARHDEDQRQLLHELAMAVVHTHGCIQRCRILKRHLKNGVLSILRQMLQTKCRAVKSVVLHHLQECHHPQRLEQVCRREMEAFLSAWKLCDGHCRCTHPCLKPAKHDGPCDCYSEERLSQREEDFGQCTLGCEQCSFCRWYFIQ